MLTTDLNEIQRLAIQRADEFDILRYMLQEDDDLQDEHLDARIETIAAPIIAAIDCTQCANCCRSLNIYLTPEDAEHLSTGMYIPVATILTNYIDHEGAKPMGEWGKFNAKPCPLLKGNLCSVYTHRPETCRLYPQFTPDFRWVLDDLIDGAGLCPIIYNVLSAVNEQIEDIIKNP